MKKVVTLTVCGIVAYAVWLGVNISRGPQAKWHKVTNPLVEDASGDSLA